MGIDGINPMRPAAQQRLRDAGIDDATIGIIANAHAQMLGMPVADDASGTAPPAGSGSDVGQPPVAPEDGPPAPIDSAPVPGDPGTGGQVIESPPAASFEDGYHPDYPTMLKSQVLILQTIGVPDVTLNTWRAEGWSQFQVDEWLQDHVLDNPYSFDREYAEAFGVERADGTTRAALDSLKGVLPPESLGIETVSGPADQPRVIEGYDATYPNLTENQVWMLRTIGYDENHINQVNAENWATTDLEKMLREVVAYPAEFDARMGHATGTTRQRLIDAGFDPSTVGTGQYNDQGEPIGVPSDGSGTPADGNGAVTGGGSSDLMRNILTGAGAVAGGVMLWRFKQGKNAGMSVGESLRGGITHPFRNPLAEVIRSNAAIGPNLSHRTDVITKNAERLGLIGAGGFSDADAATEALLRELAETGTVARQDLTPQGLQMVDQLLGDLPEAGPVAADGLSAKAQLLQELGEVNAHGTPIDVITQPPDPEAAFRAAQEQAAREAAAQAQEAGQPPHNQTLGLTGPIPGQQPIVAGAPASYDPNLPAGLIRDVHDPSGQKLLIENIRQPGGYSLSAMNVLNRMGLDPEALLHAELGSVRSDDLLRSARGVQPPAG